MRTLDLGLIPYNDAWKIQEEVHAQVVAGEEETLLLLEHPPVITLGRRAADSQKNLLAPPHILQQMGVEVVESDRGGDVTFHGPGQLVAYPILRLADHRLSVGGYMQKLQDIVIATLGEYGIEAHKDPTAIGAWVSSPSPGTPGEGRGEGPARLDTNTHQFSKICALGVRIKRGVSLHGLALNLATDLSYFNLINPCGLNRPVTSLQQLLGKRAPTMDHLKQSLTRHFLTHFTRRA
jgi:lipoate-protein ligase B